MASDIASQELIDRAAALVPAFRGRQAETERNRRVPDESINEILNAGLYRIHQPQAFGGLESDLTTFFRVAAIIASGCGSTGWVYATSAQHQWMIGMFAAQAQQDVWGRNPRSFAAASFNPSGGVAVIEADGFRLNGSWAFSSGVDNAAWMILGVRVAKAQDGEPVDMGFVLVPKSDYSVDDDWHVAGLAGTGSKTVNCDDVKVPGHRFLPLADAQSGHPPGAEVNTGDLFKVPFFAAISVCLSAAVIGMARGTLDDFLEAARERMPDSPTIELRVGEARGLIDAAGLLVEGDCDDIGATIAAGNELSESQRARNKGHLGLASRFAVQAIDLLFEAGDGAGLFTSDRVQRAWRDAHAGAMHISLNWDSVGVLYGRVELGLEPGTTQF